MGLVAAHRAVYELVLFRPLEYAIRVASTESPGSLGCAGARRRRNGHRPDGALRLGSHPRARHPGGDRIDPDQRQPRGAEAGHPEAALVGDLHRIGRTVWRRRSDHHDRRRVRIDDRAIFPFDQRGAQDAAGGRRRGRHVGDVQRADCGAPARRGTAAVRMEAAQPDSRRPGERNGGRGALVHSGRRRAVSGPAASTVRRRGDFVRMSARGLACGRALGAVNSGGLCCRGRFSTPADSLDVVAGDRRIGRRNRRIDFPAGAGRRLRHHRRAAARRRSAQRNPGNFAGEIRDLGGFAGVGNLRRSAGAAADDGRSAGRPGSGDSCRIPASDSGRWSAWARFSAAPCVRPSPESCSPSS